MPVDPKRRKTTIEVTNSMKDYLRYIIVLALISFLCTGFVSAAGSGTATKDKRANETIQVRTSLVSAPSETDRFHHFRWVIQERTDPFHSAGR